MNENKIISLLTVCIIAVLFALPLVLKNNTNVNNATFDKTIAYMNSHSVVQF